MDLLEQRLCGFDGRELKVFYSEPAPGKAGVVVVLPFGVRFPMADRAYAALAERFNVVTWESRFVLDHQADTNDARIDAEMHVRDLERIIRFTLELGEKHEAPPLVNVIGYCSGAGIALLGAARFHHLIFRLVLVSGEYMLSPALCEPGGFQREVDAILPLAAESRENAQFLFESISSARNIQQSEFHRFISLPFSSPEYLYRFGLNYLSYRDNDFVGRAAQVMQPTLVVFARDDRQVAPASSEIVFRALPNPAGLMGVDGDHYEFCRANPAMFERIAQFLGGQ